MLSYLVSVPQRWWKEVGVQEHVDETVRSFMCPLLRNASSVICISGKSSYKPRRKEAHSDGGTKTVLSQLERETTAIVQEGELVVHRMYAVSKQMQMGRSS